MGNIIKHLRGTSSDHETYTGEKGVISVVTGEGPDYIPTGEIRVHDGQTPGGINPVDTGIAAVSAVTTADVDAVASDVDNVANNLSFFEDRFVGMIASFAMETPPAGWHICNGGEYSLTNYPELYAVIGTTWGDLTDGSGGAGDTHFRVPDLRGEFLRGFDDAAGNDPDSASRTGGNVVGSSQLSMVRDHVHWLESWAGYNGNSGSYNPRNQGYGNAGPYGESIYSRQISDDTTQANKNFVGGSETRPRNKYVQFCIKY